MQTLQQNQGKKTLVRYLLGPGVSGSLDSRFGNQGSKSIRQTRGGVRTAETRETRTLYPVPYTQTALSRAWRSLTPTEEGMVGS